MTPSSRVEREPTLSIGALSRATGIPVETLRTWERRYGFPRASRRPSGHRLYALSAVPRLRRVVRAIAYGHRPADVMRLEEKDLEALLATAQGGAWPEPRITESAARPSQRASGRQRDLLDAVATYSGVALQAGLELAAARATPVRFLEETVAPLMRDVGRAWKSGRLDVRHEHFAAGRVGDFLRELRHRLEPRGHAPRTALALLPGEEHELGLLMAAVVFASSGWWTLYLGRETPVPQLVAVVQDAGLDAVGLSVSPTAPAPEARTALKALRSALPPRVAVLVGGAGAPERLVGVSVFSDLTGLERWLAAHPVG